MSVVTVIYLRYREVILLIFHKWENEVEKVKEVEYLIESLLAEKEKTSKTPY